MRETWYILEDGAPGDPTRISTGDDGLLRHQDGRPVAYADHGPRSREVDAEKERAKAEAAEAKSGKSGPKAERETKPAEAGSGYQTRESKAN